MSRISLAKKWLPFLPKNPPETTKRFGKIIGNNVFQDTGHTTTKDNAPCELGGEGRVQLSPLITLKEFPGHDWWGRGGGETRRSLMESNSCETELRVWGDHRDRRLESVVLQRYTSNSHTAVEICTGSSLSIPQSTNQSMCVRKLS